MDAPPSKPPRSIRKNRILHPCPQCGKSFTKRSNMLIHARLHTGEKPYVCKYAGCGRSYKWLSSINFHQGRCERKQNGLAVPAPRPPPPPAAAEAARLATEAARLHSLPPPHPLPPPPTQPLHHLPPPLPSYHSLQMHTQGRTPSPPPPPPPPLRPPPQFAPQPPYHQQAAVPFGPPLAPMQQPPHPTQQSLHHPLSTTTPPNDSSGFRTPRTQPLNHPPHPLSVPPTSPSRLLRPSHPPVLAHPNPPHSPITPPASHPLLRPAPPDSPVSLPRNHPKSQLTAVRRHLTFPKRGRADPAPGSPESASSKEIRDMLAPYAPAMLLGGTLDVVAKGCAQQQQVAHQAQGQVQHPHHPDLEAIGHSFGLSDEDLFIANCSIVGSVFDELAAGEEYAAALGGGLVPAQPPTGAPPPPPGNEAISLFQ